MFNFNDLKIPTLAKFAYEEKFSGCQIYFLNNTIALIPSALASFEGVLQVFCAACFSEKINTKTPSHDCTKIGFL
jgi:hypothetical protein